MSSEKNARVVVTVLGGPEVLTYVEEQMPQPGAGQVRVRVLAAGVAYADILMRRGKYPGGPKPPFTPGYDIVGDIDKVGEGVDEFRVGRRVAALTMQGGYSKFTIVPAANLVAVPDELNAAEAVSLVVNYVTAYQMMHRVAHLGAGQRLLVHSAAGGVGTAALQLGKVAGLEMYGTASKPKHELVAALGGTPIDYRTENFVKRIRELAPGGLDCVLDPVGGTQWWRSHSCLRRGGHLLCYGVQAAVSKGQMAAGLGFALYGLMKIIPDGKHASWFNVRVSRDEKPEWFREDLSHLFELLAGKDIKPVIGATFPLREVARANEMLEKGQASGKIVLLPWE